MKIKEHLKNVLPKETYDLWIEPIIEKTITTKKTYQNIPDNRAVTGYQPNMYNKTPYSAWFGYQRYINEQWFKPQIVEETIEETVLIVPNVYFKSKISEILTEHNLKATIEIDEQLEQATAEIRPQSNIKTFRMEKPYGKEKVATSDMINAKFFTYPTSRKTKYGVTETTFKDQEYIVHRGKKTTNPKEEPIGQLDTTHLKILLAIIHIWQEQNCQFLGIQAVIKVSETLKEIAEKIGYKAITQNTKWLQQKVDELTKYPITIERKYEGNKTSFTFLNEVTTQTKEENANKRTVVLTLHQLLSKELYDREKSNILRNKECYRIKNPASLKFLLTYDKRIYASREPFKLQIEDIAQELELRGEKKDIIEAIKKIIKNLNGYKITNNEEIMLEFKKEGKEKYLVVSKREIIPQLPFKTTEKEEITLKLET
jgi:hypothetical protein